MSTLTSQNSNPKSHIDIDSKLGIEPQLPELKLKKYAPISNSNSTFQLFSTPKSSVNSSSSLKNNSSKITSVINNNNTNTTNITNDKNNNNGNSLSSRVPSAPSSISSAGSSNLSYKKRSSGSNNLFQQRNSSIESTQNNSLKNGENRAHSSLTSLKQRIKQQNLNEQQQQQQHQQDELKNIGKTPNNNLHKQKSQSLTEERKLIKQRKLIEKQRKQKSLDLSTRLNSKQSQNNITPNSNSLNKNNEDDSGMELLQETQEVTSTLLNARKKLMNDLNIDSILYQQRVNAICDTKNCDNLDMVDAYDNSGALLNTDQLDLNNSYHGFDGSMADESGDFMSLDNSVSNKNIDSLLNNETPSGLSLPMLKSGTSSNRFNDSNMTTNKRSDSMGMSQHSNYMINIGSSLQNEMHRYDDITSRFLHIKQNNNNDNTSTEDPDTVTQHKKFKISHSTRDRAERVDSFIRKYYSSLDKYVNSGRMQNGEKEIKHPGVEGVFNPLQIIRNRRVRRKHKERFKDSILTDIPLPSQVFSKYDEQRLIWQINLQEYLDDISWREFHWNELKDHNNKLWFPNSSDKKKSHTQRHSDHHQKHQHRDKYKAYIKDKFHGDNNNEKEFRMHEQLFADNKSNSFSPSSKNNNNNGATAPGISMNESNDFNNGEFDNNNINLPPISSSRLNRHNVDANEDLADDSEYLATVHNDYNYELEDGNIMDDSNTDQLNNLQINNGSFTSSKFSSAITPNSATNLSKTDQQQQGSHSNLHLKFKRLSKSPARLLAGVKSKDDVRLRSSSITNSAPEETMISEIPSLLSTDNIKKKSAFDNSERGRPTNDLEFPSIIISKADSRDESILENVNGNHRSSNAEVMEEINNLENGYNVYTMNPVTPNINDYLDDEKMDDDVIHYMHDREYSTDSENKPSSILNTHFKKVNESGGFNESTVSLTSNMTDYLHNSNSNSNSRSFQNSKMKDNNYDDVSDDIEDHADYDGEDEEDGEIFDRIDEHSQSSVLGIYDQGEAKNLSEQESQRQIKLLKSLLGQVVVSEIHLMALTKKRFSIIKNHEDNMTKSHDEFNLKMETNGDLQRKALKLINEVEEKIEDSNTISNREANKVDELLGYCDRTIGDINTSIALQVRNLNEKIERLSSSDKLTATEDDITKWFYVFVENFIVLLLWFVWIIVEFWRIFRLLFRVIIAILRWIFL